MLFFIRVEHLAGRNEAVFKDEFPHSAYTYDGREHFGEYVRLDRKSLVMRIANLAKYGQDNSTEQLALSALDRAHP